MAEQREILLPQNGDTLFRYQRMAEPIRPRLGIWPAWSNAWRAAADVLVDVALDEPEPLAAKIYPIVYLYRHSLELELKSVVALTFIAAEVENTKEEVKEIFRTHDLVRLVQLFVAALKMGAEQHEERVFALPSSLAGSVESFLACVEEMSKLDPNSDLLRFPINRQFRQGTRQLDGLDLGSLKVTMSKLANFLRITRKSLEDLIDFRSEESSSALDASLGVEELRDMTIGEADELF